MEKLLKEIDRLNIKLYDASKAKDKYHMDAETFQHQKSGLLAEKKCRKATFNSRRDSQITG
jgi:hypothetical protein